jgi:hypothetical protein
MSFFKRQVGKVVFFTKNSPKYFEGDYSLILSPQFYWIKRVKLPVKSEYKAKKLAPSVFEGTLPEGEKYFYDVQYEKDRDSFVVIAYSKEYIYKSIREKISPMAKIRGIYFAQYELGGLKTCIAIDKEISLGNVDGLLIQVPSVCVQSEENVKKYLPKVNLSTKRIKIDDLEDTSHLNDYIYYFIFLGFFLVAQIITYFAYSRDITKYDDMKQNLIVKYHLPKTSFQLDSIKKSLQEELKEQKIIKNALLKLDKIVFNKDEKYMNIVIRKNSATFHIKTAKDRAETLLIQFKRRFSVTSANFADGILKLEVNL